jgi:hypothetical protein
VSVVSLLLTVSLLRMLYSDFALLGSTQSWRLTHVGSQFSRCNRQRRVRRIIATTAAASSSPASMVAWPMEDAEEEEGTGRGGAARAVGRAVGDPCPVEGSTISCWCVVVRVDPLKRRSSREIVLAITASATSLGWHPSQVIAGGQFSPPNALHTSMTPSAPYCSAICRCSRG